MCTQTKVLTMDADKQGILINGMIAFRNGLLEQDKPVEDVNEVIDDLINAPSSERTTHRLFPRKREKCALSVAPPLPTKSDDFAGAPYKEKRKMDRAER